MVHEWDIDMNLGPPNVALLRALWALLDGIWGLLKGSWGVLVLGAIQFLGNHTTPYLDPKPTSDQPKQNLKLWTMGPFEGHKSSLGPYTISHS